MAQASSNNSTRRRDFLALAAAAATAAMAQPALASSLHDSELLKLEEQIFEQHELAAQYDDEIDRTSAIWTAESNRLYQEALAEEVRTGVYLSAQERWKIVADIPEAIEHNRLSSLQEPHYVEMDKLVAQMWATPAHTPEGRRAKVLVLLGCILRGDGWRETDNRVEYERARDLLIEFVGGEPADQLREQFV